MPRYACIEDRILANSYPADDSFYDGSACWIWMGKVQINNRGAAYPAMTMRYKSGPRKGKVRNVRVHRLSVELFKGRRVTPRMVVQHLCNNPLCVNPEHLKGGTQKANVRQCVAEGRHKTPFRDPEMRVAL